MSTRLKVSFGLLLATMSLLSERLCAQEWVSGEIAVNGEAFRAVEVKDASWVNTPLAVYVRELGQTEERMVEAAEGVEVRVPGQWHLRGARVVIENSPDYLQDQRYGAEPDTSVATVFLRKRVDGAASLFELVRNVNIRYYSSLNNSPPALLMYKRYRFTSREGVESRKEARIFVNQLHDLIDCETIDNKTLIEVDYTRRELSRLFEAWNACLDSPAEVLRPKRRKMVQVAIVGGVERSLLSNQPPGYVDRRNRINPYLNGTWEWDAVYGVDVTKVFNFNRLRWSAFVQPSLSVVSASNQIEPKVGFRRLSVGGPDTIYYERRIPRFATFQLPIGARYAFALHPDLGIYASVAALFNFPANKASYQQEYTSFRPEIERRAYIQPRFEVGVKCFSQVNIGYVYIQKQSFAPFENPGLSYRRSQLLVSVQVLGKRT